MDGNISHFYIKKTNLELNGLLTKCTELQFVRLCSALRVVWAKRNPLTLLAEMISPLQSKTARAEGEKRGKKLAFIFLVCGILMAELLLTRHGTNVKRPW